MDYVKRQNFLNTWAAELHDANGFEGCVTRADIESVLEEYYDLEELRTADTGSYDTNYWDYYEITMEDLVAAACSAVGTIDSEKYNG